MTVDFKDSWSTVQTLVCLFCCFSIPNTKAQSTEMLNDGKILYLHCFFVSPKFACMKCDLVFTCRISYNQCCITKYFILENECYSSTALMLFILVLSYRAEKISVPKFMYWIPDKKYTCTTTLNTHGQSTTFLSVYME